MKISLVLESLLLKKSLRILFFHSLSFMDYVKRHVQIPNAFLDNGFRKIRAGNFKTVLPARITHHDLENFGIFWKLAKKGNPANQYLQGF